nr:ROK family protein [Bacillus pacificus]
MAFNGRAHIGGNGTAGEWGHNPLPWMDEDELRYREEVPCYCGKQGCIETFISGTGFAMDYRRLCGHALKGSEIIRLVEECDPVAELALRRYELRLAKSLAHVSRRPSGLRKTRTESNSLAHRTTWHGS